MKESKKNETENQVPEIFRLEAEALEEIRKQAKEKTVKQSTKWVQRGVYVVCVSGENEYGIYVGTRKQLVGIDENGRPVLRDI